ncbi:MAG: DUF4178 domain-containing protein [Elusimicrobiota bacterium]|nr:MAG: DUF4178 domain-containing protein [Elusimicrobiota bacterium]
MPVLPRARAQIGSRRREARRIGPASARRLPLQVGARGVYRAAPFDVVGRVQLKTPRGFWNEWCLVFADGRQGWLGEAQGTYAVSFKVEQKAPDLRALKLGAKVDVEGTVYEVREIIEAAYLAAQGELPFRPRSARRLGRPTSSERRAPSRRSTTPRRRPSCSPASTRASTPCR